MLLQFLHVRGQEQGSWVGRGGDGVELGEGRVGGRVELANWEK